MKKNLLNQLRSETLENLLTRLSQEKKELANLYVELTTKKLKNTRKIFHKRKDISQILTLINEKRREK